VCVFDSTTSYYPSYIIVLARMADAPGADTSQQQRTKRKDKKKKKEAKIEIHLYVNGIPYEYGVICGFCTKETAVWHCPDCPDFFCASCDTINHSVKKRKHHIRKMLSKLTKDAAAGLITHAVRYHGHLRLLQLECKKVFRRYFDPKSLNHYYYNPIYKTVSWTKPYCLRKLDLVPFMTHDQAAARMQVLYRMWRARCAITALLKQNYRKVFDRRRMRFYYAFLGKSKVIPSQSWKKPRYFGKRGFFKDIDAVYTADIAALTIQRKWRAVLVRRFFHALVRASFEQQWDAVHGRYTYYHRATEKMWEHKPKILGNQPWDPNYVPDWPIERVRLFLRRIGMKQYLVPFGAYGVDGKVLPLLDKEDFDNMKIFNKVHIRKIKVELAKIFQPKDKLYKSDMHEFRRETIKRIKAQEKAAVIIQKYFRRFAARREMNLRYGLLITQRNLEAMEAALLAMGAWYTDRPDIPSKQLIVHSSDDLVNEASSATTGNKEAKKRIKSSFEFLETIKFPPIKTFGQRQDYLSVNGWGRRDATGKWLPLVAATKHTFKGDAHPTRLFTDRLHESGYDNRRLCKFKGQAPIKLEDSVEYRKMVPVVQAANKKLNTGKKDKGGSVDDLSVANGSMVSTFSYHSSMAHNASVELNPCLDVLL
jgi:hypothetical protein